MIRQIYLPNPFVNVFSNQELADLFNLVIGGVVIGKLAYFLTGCMYEKNSLPVLGSILYTLSYIFITFTFCGITIVIKNIIIASILYLCIYFIICLFLSNFKSEQSRI